MLDHHEAVSAHTYTLAMTKRGKRCHIYCTVIYCEPIHNNRPPGLWAVYYESYGLLVRTVPRAGCASRRSPRCRRPPRRAHAGSVCRPGACRGSPHPSRRSPDMTHITTVPQAPVVRIRTLVSHIKAQGMRVHKCVRIFYKRSHRPNFLSLVGHTNLSRKSSAEFSES